MREWVAKKLGRFHAVTVTQVSDLVWQVPELGDFSEDDERFVDSYLLLVDNDDAMPQWRRITAVNMVLSPPQISINRALSPEPTNGSEARIMGLLTPDEWNDAINEALVVLYYRERHTETLRTATMTDPGREYEMPSWVTHRGMIIGVKYRNVSTGQEQDVPRFRLQESRNIVTVELLDPPYATTSYELIVETHRFNTRLDEDNWGTTCPQPLWQAAVEVAVIHKVIKKYGARFKSQFSQDLAIAERDLAQQRAAILPKLIAAEYSDPDGFNGPDMGDDLFSSWSSW